MILRSAKEVTARPDKRSHDGMTASEPIDETQGAILTRPTKKTGGHFTQSGIVTVVAGKGKQQEQFVVHRDRLCDKSRFFEGCLKHDCVETETRRIELPDDRPVAVRTYINWAYTEKVNITLDKEIEANYPEIYAFADKVCAEDLCNCLVDSLMTFNTDTRSYMGIDRVERLYHLGLRHKQLTKFVVEDLVACVIGNAKVKSPDEQQKKNRAEILSEITSLCEIPELAEDVMKLMLAYHSGPVPLPEDREACYYHDHTEGNKCSAREDEEKEAPKGS